jgi:hypothetical protein
VAVEAILGRLFRVVDGATTIVGDARHCHVFPFPLSKPQLISVSENEDVTLEVTDGRGSPMQTHRVRLDQFEQGNAARGHAGEVEAAPCRAMEAMTSRRFPAPWRADKIPGG